GGVGVAMAAAATPEEGGRTGIPSLLASAGEEIIAANVTQE
uniref:Uncharacterized protein n=1 Tax=Oryza brachyantha TaxID=4533 RepID=J3MF37_ORYBR